MTARGKQEDVQIGRALRLDRRAALDLLRDLARDRAVLSDLRRLWAKEAAATSLSFTSDAQVIAQLADRVATGALVIARVVSPLPKAPPPGAGAVDGATEAPSSSATEQAEEQKSWIEISVVDLSTGAPLSDVPLLITPPSGSEAEHKTDANGAVRLDKIPGGPCLVRCEMGEAGREDALIFLGSGGGAPAPPAGGAAGKDEKKKKGTPAIVAVEKHKVRTGETLDGLAKSVGSTWQKVAKFNWGTDDPKKINRFLRSEVGCTKKTKDGKSYLFDDSDDPGIILLPQEWKASMDTGGAYTVEVVSATAPKKWIFSL